MRPRAPIVLTVVVAALLATPACFAPTLPDCAFTCGGDPPCPPDLVCQSNHFCHPAGDTRRCFSLDGSVDAPLRDGAADATRLTDAPVDAPVADARVDAAADARDCSGTCTERVCGKVGDCECSKACPTEDWCTDYCVFAECDDAANECCLPEDSPCSPGLGQCCAGLLCAAFCVQL